MARETANWTITINRTPDEVFSYLSDVSKHAEWSPKPYRAEGTSGPVTTGDTFISVGQVPGDKEHRNEVTVTECSPPTRLVLDAVEEDQHYISTFELRPADDGTTLTRSIDAPKPGGVLGLAFPLIMKLFISPDVQKGLNKLKANLERE